MNSKKQIAALLMTAVLAGPAIMTPTVMANSVDGNVEEQADITNWVANTPQQISNNMAMQHINTNDLNGTKYIVQWGDTLSGISDATGISVAKLAYDNHIQNINLIYAGQTLILNRTGNVPTDYHYDGDPNQVVISKTTINNGPKNVKFVVSPKVTVNNDNSDNSTTTNNTTTNDNDSEEDNSSTTVDSTKKHSNKTTESSTSEPDSEKLADKLSSAAASKDDDVSYSAYTVEDADDMKSVDLGHDSLAINKAVKKGHFKKAEQLIKDHLDDDDYDVYVDDQDGDVSVYTKKDSDKDSSSDDEDNDNSSSQDNDNQQSDTNDDYDAEEDDD